MVGTFARMTPRCFYFVTVCVVATSIVRSQLILKVNSEGFWWQMRVHEDRARFSGYDVANFKIFAFCFGALLAGIGGAMFTLNVGFIHPTFVGIVPSIEMVIFCAVGGRFLNLWSRIWCAARECWQKRYFPRPIQNFGSLLWGLMFIGVVLAFQDGLAGSYTKII